MKSIPPIECSADVSVKEVLSGLGRDNVEGVLSLWDLAASPLLGLDIILSGPLSSPAEPEE